MSKRHLRIDRLIIVILTGILIIGLLGLGIYELFDKFSSNKKPDNQIQDAHQLETIENIKCDLKDYIVYVDDTNSLGFNFIIANIEFTGNDKVSFNLNDFQTSEKVGLGNVSSYLNKLKNNGYDVEKLHLDNVVSSKEKNVVCKIFVPYTTDSEKLQLYNANNPEESITFDLTDFKYVTALKFDNSQDIKVDNTDVTVSSCSISTMMLHDNEEYNVGSTSKVFTFKIQVNKVQDDIKIVDAYFIKDSDDEKIHCLDERYSSEKIDNILNKKLTTSTKGALFFQVYAPENDPDYSGVLLIQFSNSSDWVELNTNLE